jgi:hypothetical protein
MNAWTNYTSEEYQPVICDGNNAMNGFGSTGKYSDNIRMKCASSPNPNFWARSSSWSIYISDDGANYAGCAPGQFITGFACRGAYCDDVAVQCTQMLSLPSWSAVNCHWVGPFSEENGTSNLFGTGWFAKSVRCTGKYCDNMEFEVCYANGGY